MRRKFEERAALTVYLERRVLTRFAERAEQANMSAADYALALVMEHMNAGDNPGRGNSCGEDARIAPDPKPGERVRETIKQLEAEVPRKIFR